MLSLVGEAKRSELVPKKESFDVILTNRVAGTGDDRTLLAVGPGGQVGSWTMVFDEGFEVRLGERRYAAKFEFELLPSKRARDGDLLEKIGQFYGRAEGHT